MSKWIAPYSRHELVMPGFKYCSRCNREVPRGNYYKSSNPYHRFGLKNYCKECWLGCTKRYYLENRKEQLEKGKAWRKTNPERMQKARDDWANKNPEKVKEYGQKSEERRKQWRKENPIEAKILDSQKHLKNKEKRNIESKIWRSKNPERVRQYQAKRRASILDAWVEDIDRTILLKRDNNICGICKDKNNPVDINSFHIDHVIPLCKGGKHSYENTQVAHPLCNQRKQGKMQEEYEEYLNAI